MTKTHRRRRLYDPAPHAMPAEGIEVSNRYPDVYYNYEPGPVRALHAEGQVFHAETQGRVGLQIEVWSETVVRIRFRYLTLWQDHSYAIREEARPEPVSIVQTEDEDYYYISTEQLTCRLDKADATIQLTDRSNGAVMLEQVEPFCARESLLRGLEQMRLRVSTTSDEGFFGLGDKSWNLNLRGRHFENWCTDAFAFTEERDPLYRAIPFYYGLRDGLGYGIFLHNTWRTHFDFDSYDDNTVTLWTEGGEFDYFYLHGPQLLNVARRYHHLTGVPELPPLWALGFHQCRWTYFPDRRFREVAHRFRELSIPCDALYLDIDYMDDYRCFTWNRQYFADPKAMVADLAREGFHTVVMIDPGIKVDPEYPVYRDGLEQDVFCRRSTGEHMIGPVWPPECVWPDFTNPRVRQWWGPLYRELYLEHGVSGFWNDMNEPAMFKVNHMTFPDGVRHDYDGHPCDHRQAHNVYGQQMARATHEGLKHLQPAKRPFVLTRANFCGGQRYAAVWTGDNISSWEHLQLANLQCQRLSASGFSICGTDIGGFVEQPTGELLVRWLQLGAFHMIFRIHSIGNNIDGASEADAEEIRLAEATRRLDQEPWSFGEPWTGYAREAISLRYRLLPYLYTALYQHMQTGVPLLRSLVFYDQSDERCRERENEFLCGSDLLVSPVTRPGARSQTVYLPRGEWYDFFTGKKYQGQQLVRMRLRPDRLPLFVRGGALVPEFPVVQHTGQLPAETLILRTFVAAEGASHFFWDAGEGYGYVLEQYLLCRFEQRLDGRTWTLHIDREGRFNPTITGLQLRLTGLPFEPHRATADDEPVALEIVGAEVVLEVPFGVSVVRIEEVNQEEKEEGY